MSNHHHANNKRVIKAYDERRDYVIPGTTEETIDFCFHQFIDAAKKNIEDHGYFAVALSGGKTPEAIFRKLSAAENRDKVDWSRVMLFWSDERCVAPSHKLSNYNMAMQSGFHALPIPMENIFRMKGEEDPEEAAKEYDQIIRDRLSGEPFDMIMLGVGDDGHTASLFPKTHALQSGERLAVANYVPQNESWRLTLTFKSINSARLIVVYLLGDNKAVVVKRIFNEEYQPDILPIQRVGTPTHKAVFIMDAAAAGQFKEVF